MKPEEPKSPDAHEGTQEGMTNTGRIRNTLRYALLPLAALALVAFMIFGVPALDAGSQAVQDLQPQPPRSATAPAGTPESVAPASPIAAATSPTTPPSVLGGATGEAALTSSLEGVAPTGITVPAAGIDVPVLPLLPTAEESATQSIVPPATDDGYWLTSYGAPGAGSTDTTYIAGHSWEGRDAPFDLFSTNVRPGDTVILHTVSGPLTYVVDGITTHDKDSLKNSDIWNITPHRLVIISCFTEDPWGKNVIVTASPVS